MALSQGSAWSAVGNFSLPRSSGDIRQSDQKSPLGLPRVSFARDPAKRHSRSLGQKGQGGPGRNGRGVLGWNGLVGPAGPACRASTSPAPESTAAKEGNDAARLEEALRTEASTDDCTSAAPRGSEDAARLEEALQGGKGSLSGAEDRYWQWRGFNIRYQQAGEAGPALVLVHGFGANCDHWRNNIGPLSQQHRVFAVDLLGYGYSSKPDPRVPASTLPNSTPYKFETWAAQLNDFISQVVGGSAFLVCNSVGGVAGLQAAVDNPSLCRGVILLNVSLRMLHVTKQSPLARPAVAALQWTLRNTDLGKLFFRAVATPRAVGNILRQCYADPEKVSPELVELILKPGLEPGAVDVFLDFIGYSGGPLPEELIPRVQCPVLIGWGEADPWEPVAMGKAFAGLLNVEDFVVFPGVGHCPQDEAPSVVNQFIEGFVAKHT